jgi:hypothetical protein
MPKSTTRKRPSSRGRLRIGDDWNAINIIALSQSNPLKAVAEFVENSIDARARNITIVRGKEKGEHFLRITDDGQGIPRGDNGEPDFKYVATHICDSIKRHLKADGATGIQGEFGIGLLSFWTLGESMTVTSSASDGKTFQMNMKKGNPGYTVTPRRLLFPSSGTEITVKPLLPGLRILSGEKIQWYLASELRDRIRTSGVKVQVIDRQARKQYAVEPRQFEGRLLHQLPPIVCPVGEIYAEIYLAETASENRVELHRSGTRVLESMQQIDQFDRAPWSEGYLQGLVDVPFLQLTPGTRLGIIQEQSFADFCQALKPLEVSLAAVIDEQRRAQEERASRNVLRTIQKAFREALLALPEEEYDWFDLRRRSDRGRTTVVGKNNGTPDDDGDVESAEGIPGGGDGAPAQKDFFEHAGPLFSARIAPASSVVPVNESRTLQAVPRDRSRRRVERDLAFSWSLIEGGGRITESNGEIATFHAPEEPGLTRIGLIVRQGDIECEGEALVTVTDSLLTPERGQAEQHKGMPDYSLRHAPGELWRSKFDAEHNVILVNKGHRDYVYASRNKALKLRYLCRLFAKELVLKNFPGLPREELMERMIELSTYTEEHLR